MTIRPITEQDYPPVISVLNDWWGGRRMSDMLPRLFFKHFQQTSFIAEENGVIQGFLVGFISQSHPDQAYIHFVGIHPDHRKGGMGKGLYKKFFDTVKNHGCKTVHLVTSPDNTNSIAYHAKMGFMIEKGNAEANGVLIHTDYDGPREDRVLFLKEL